MTAVSLLEVPSSPGSAPMCRASSPSWQNLVKLNTNEHPFRAVAPSVLDAMPRGLATRRCKLYPRPGSDRLRAGHRGPAVGVQPQQVFVGNGSDEVLAHAFLALLKHDRPLRVSGHYLQLLPGVLRPVRHRSSKRCPHRGLPHRRPKTICRRATARPAPSSSPEPQCAHRPRAAALADVERIVAGNSDTVVVVDEAYVDFGARIR